MRIVCYMLYHVDGVLTIQIMFIIFIIIITIKKKNLCTRYSGKKTKREIVSDERIIHTHII